MGFWRRAQAVVWTGRVIRDYGVTADRESGHVRETLSVLIADGHGPRVFLKRSYSYRWLLGLGAGVQFFELDADEVEKLNSALSDAIRRMRADKREITVG